ncbi:hypothetical protein Tco_0352871 [Tanacetum coccineum]
MADNRTMAQMLQAPIEGYEDAIVVPPINANNFELKQPLINLVQSNKFTGAEMKPELLDKEPPRSILTWDDLVAKFINQFFPPSKTTYYRNEIITFSKNRAKPVMKHGNVLKKKAAPSSNVLTMLSEDYTNLIRFIIPMNYQYQDALDAALVAIF